MMVAWESLKERSTSSAHKLKRQAALEGSFSTEKYISLGGQYSVVTMSTAGEPLKEDDKILH